MTTNDVAYDKEAKEYVIITNGRCTLDHSGPEAFKLSHPNNAPCVYAPSEAIALRAVSDGEGFALGWTYRGVKPEMLSEVTATDAKAFRDAFQATFQGRKRVGKVALIGRV